jgi:hypothetical protein
MAPLIPVAVSLISSVVPELLKLFGSKKQAEVAEAVIKIAKDVTGLEDPNEASAEIVKDPELALKFKQAVFDQQIKLEEIAFRRDSLYINDTQDARRYRDSNVFRLGVMILLSFLIVMSGTLWFLYNVATAKVIVDPVLLAAIFTLLGSIIGYFASNAQQVVSFFFGSSQGSKQRGDDMADAIKLIKR